MISRFCWGRVAVAQALFSAVLLSSTASTRAQLPKFTSIVVPTGTRASSAYGLGVDGFGNCYLAGFFGSPTLIATINFGTTNLTASGGNDGYLAKYNSEGICQWARQIGGVGRDEAIKLAVHRNGDSYVVGEFTGSASLGSSNLMSAGGTDLFLARFNSAGELHWVHSAGSGAKDSAYSVAVNNQGDCFITGFFQGNARFGGINIVSLGAEDGFLAKYRPDGNVEWVRTAAGLDLQIGTDVATDSDGNPYMVGEFLTAVSFGATNLSQPPSASEGVFITKYDLEGNLLWARKAGEGDNAGVGRIAVDINRNVFVSGSFSGQYAIDGETLNGGVTDVFFAKYSSNGQAQWSRMFGGNDADAATDIAIDELGASYLAGHFRGTAFIGSNSVTSSGNSDVLITKYNHLGELQWSQTAGGPLSDVALAVALDGPYRLYLAGEFGGTANFGGISVSTSDALQKPYLARLDVGAELKINRQPLQVILSWSTNLTGFVLEATPSLAPNENWSPIQPLPVVVNRDYVVTREIGTNSQLFRLKAISAP